MSTQSSDPVEMTPRAQEVLCEPGGWHELGALASQSSQRYPKQPIEGAEPQQSYLFGGKRRSVQAVQI
jgi:hypothetical protein